MYMQMSYGHQGEMSLKFQSEFKNGDHNLGIISNEDLKIEEEVSRKKNKN